MGLFDGIGNAAIGQGGTYLKSGHNYLLEIVKCFMKQGRKGDVFFIAEFMVHESDDLSIPPGFTASWTANFSQHDAALGNVLWLLGAANGIDVRDEARLKSEITTAVAEFAVSAQNPLKGRMVEVETHEIKTRAGSPFTKHMWKPTTRTGSDAIRKAAAAAAASPQQLSGFSPPAAPPAPAAFPPPGWTAPAFPPPGWTAHPANMGAPPPVAPPAPPAPMAAPPPPPPAPFPPPGWAAHPASPGWFYKGQEVLTEADLRQRAAAGRA